MLWCQVVPPENQPESELHKNSGVFEVPEAGMMLASVTHIVGDKLGFTRSLDKQQSMLGDGQPIPMMSYALVEYLMGIDLSAFDILELGGGESTAFWASKAKSVTTLETNAEWAASLRQRNLPHTDIRHVEAEMLPAAIGALGHSFDAIIVDASASRYAAAKASLPLLKPGGFILLDNADWYPNTTAMLRQADLIQMDFADFRPLRWFRCVSSLFLHPQFRARPVPGKALPVTPLGGKNMAVGNNWDAIV